MKKSIFKKFSDKIDQAVYAHDEDEQWLKKYGDLLKMADYIHDAAYRKQRKMEVLTMVEDAITAIEQSAEEDERGFIRYNPVKLAETDAKFNAKLRKIRTALICAKEILRN